MAPATPIENNLWGTEFGKNTFIREYRKSKRALEYMHEPYEIKLKDGKREKIKIQGDLIEGRSGNASIFARTSEDLSFIPDDSVDAVITDPPYFDNVMYTELSDFFYVWLRLALRDVYHEFEPQLSDKDREIVKNDVLGKDTGFFLAGLKRTFKECKRVLKPNGIMAFTFHHKRAEAWETILDAVMDAGFVIHAMYPLHSETRSGIHTVGKASITYDSILVCKPRKEEIKTLPWTIFEAQFRKEMQTEIENILRKHQHLELEDAYTITMGKALQSYSQNFTSMDPDILYKLGDIAFDVLLRKILERVPYADRISKIYAALLSNKESASYDTLNKITRHGGIDTDEFERECIVEKDRKGISILSAEERAEHIERKLERHQLNYIDAAHLLLIRRKEGKLNESMREINIDKDKLTSYVQFLADRTTI